MAVVGLGLKGIRPLLCNLHCLHFAYTVVLTEGEKKADSIPNLYLRFSTERNIMPTPYSPAAGSANPRWLHSRVKNLCGIRNEHSGAVACRDSSRMRRGPSD